MKMVFWALAAWFAVSAAAAVHVSPTNEKIQYTGRVNFSNPEFWNWYAQPHQEKVVKPKKKKH